MTLALVGIGMMAASFGWSGAGNSLLGLLLGFAALLPLYALGGMGAGDVKLMAACGASLGWKAAISAVVATYLAGGVLAVLVTAWALHKRYRLSAHTLAGLALASPRSVFVAVRGVTFPYALAIAAGCLCALGVTR